MINYHVMYMSRPDLEGPAQSDLLETIEDKTKEYGGDISDVDVWGVRKVAYRIDGYDTAYYANIYFKAAPEVAKRLDRLLRLNHSVLRHMIINMDDNYEEV